MYKIRLTGVDGLRGLAVSLVVLGHLFSYPRGGFLGVDIFFVISGYIISKRILGKSYKNIRDFYIKRMKRILPSLLLTIMIIAFGMVILKDYFFTSYIKYILTFTLNLVFLRDQSSYNFSGVSTYSPITHLWSLSIEEQFYLLAPLFFLLARLRRGIYLIAALTLASLFLYISNFSEFGGMGNYFSSLGRFWEILIGVVLATVEVRFSKVYLKWQRVGNVAIMYTLLSFLLVIAFTLTYESQFLRLGQVIVVVITALLIPLERGWLLNNKFISYIGIRSYGIYLYHIPIFYLMLTLGENIMFKFLILLILILFSALSFKFIEVKVINSKVSNRKLTLLLILSLILTLLMSTNLHKIERGGESKTLILKEMKLICSSKTIVCADENDINSNASWINCRDRKDYLPDYFSRCLVNSNHSERKVMIMGDSVALSYIPGLMKANSNYDLYMNINYGCGWISSDTDDIKLNGKREIKCNSSIKASYAYLAKIKPDVVVLSMRAQQSYNAAFVEDLGRDDINLSLERERVLGYYQKYLKQIEKFSKKVILVLPPRYLDAKNCEHPKSAFDRCEAAFKDKKIIMTYQRENRKLMEELVKNNPVLYLYDSEALTCLPSLSDCRWENPLGQSRVSQVHLSFWLSLLFGEYLDKKILSVF